MTQKTAHYDADTGPSRGTWMILLGVVAVLAIGGIGAIALASSSDSSGPELADIEPALVSGRALTQYQAGAEDEAIGREMPFVEGVDFDGNTQTLEPTGNPQGIVFLAHWCPHCQNEVPAVQDWIDDGNLPEGVELKSVATGIDASRANYPPDSWLEFEGWTPPVVVDITGQIAEAFGLSAFPYWVFVDSDGNVVQRRTGQIEVSELESILTSLS